MRLEHSPRVRGSCDYNENTREKSTRTSKNVNLMEELKGLQELRFRGTHYLPLITTGGHILSQVKSHNQNQYHTLPYEPHFTFPHLKSNQQTQVQIWGTCAITNRCYHERSISIPKIQVKLKWVIGGRKVNRDNQVNATWRSNRYWDR